MIPHDSARFKYLQGDIFGFAKVRYCWLTKNANLLFVTSALAKVYLFRHRLLRMGQMSVQRAANVMEIAFGRLIPANSSIYIK
jgi:hypothetical protein